MKYPKAPAKIISPTPYTYELGLSVRMLKGTKPMDVEVGPSRRIVRLNFEDGRPFDDIEWLPYHRQRIAEVMLKKHNSDSFFDRLRLGLYLTFLRLRFS